MSTTTGVAVVPTDDPVQTEAVAIAGFLAGYCGATRPSYATDLRLFSSWCQQANLTLFSVRRAHLELFGRWMEETGRIRSTVARRLSTLASFYKYCEQEQLVDRNPALNVRRPKVDYESRTWGWTATSSARSSSRPVWAPLATTPSPLCSPSTACGSPRPWAPTSTISTSSEGTARSRSCARAASMPSFLWHLERYGRSICTSASGARVRSSWGPRVDAWTATPPTAPSSAWPAVRESPSGSALTASGIRSSPPPWTPAWPFATSRRRPATPIPARPCATTEAGDRSTAQTPRHLHRGHLLRRRFPLAARRRYRAPVTLGPAGYRAASAPPCRAF
jgi:hypothetical protein